MGHDFAIENDVCRRCGLTRQVAVNWSQGCYVGVRLKLALMLLIKYLGLCIGGVMMHVKIGWYSLYFHWRGRRWFVLVRWLWRVWQPRFS